MAVESKVQAAWRICDFCNKSNKEIEGILLDAKRLKEAPITYSCAWKRVARVRFANKLWKINDFWKDLSGYRDTINNPSQHEGSSNPAEETWCSHYRDLEATDSNSLNEESQPKLSATARLVKKIDVPKTPKPKLLMETRKPKLLMKSAKILAGKKRHHE
jgi:hypothetical protein